MHRYWDDEEDDDENVDWCDECGADNEYSCVCGDA
jgi:hypothetical protein